MYLSSRLTTPIGHSPAFSSILRVQVVSGCVFFTFLLLYSAYPPRTHADLSRRVAVRIPWKLLC
jgi:hypothetical protein